MVDNCDVNDIRAAIVLDCATLVDRAMETWAEFVDICDDRRDRVVESCEVRELIVFCMVDVCPYRGEKGVIDCRQNAGIGVRRAYHNRAQARSRAALTRDHERDIPWGGQSNPAQVCRLLFTSGLITRCGRYKACTQGGGHRQHIEVMKSAQVPSEL